MNRNQTTTTRLEVITGTLLALLLTILVACLAVDTAHATKNTKVTIKAATVNVRHDMRPAKIRADIKEITRTNTDLIGWNEIQRTGHQAIRSLGPTWRSYQPRGLEDPISWRAAKWKPVDRGHIKLSPHRPGAGPSRHATWVALKNRQTGVVVARVNTHLVAHAFCPHRKPYKEWRKKVWAESIVKLKALNKTLASRGWVVVISGDFNRVGRVLGSTVSYDNGWLGTFGRAHYDYIAHRHDPRVHARSWRYLPRLNTDHRPTEATLTVEP